jgi:hypothetical protein
VGNRLFEEYQKLVDSFDDLFEKAETQKDKEKVIIMFLAASSDYNVHLISCLECNFDNREKKTI